MKRIAPIAKSLVFVSALFFTGQAVSAQDLSDNEVKTNVTAIESPLERINRLEPVRFEYNKANFKKLDLPSGQQYGFMSDNLQSVFPELVVKKSYTYPAGKNNIRFAKLNSADMESLVPVLVASIKELQAEVQALRNQVQQQSTANSVSSK